MKLNDVKERTLNLDWTTERDPADFPELRESAEHFAKETRLQMCFCQQDTPVYLPEATYKELASMIDGNFLKQRVRAKVLNGIQLDGFQDNTAIFTINSSEFKDNGIRYQCKVEFVEWNEVGPDPDLTYAEKARMLLWVGNIKLWCGCPSFLYWGYQYLCTAIDASIYPETRPPVKRNPQQRGIVCKHLNRILAALPFYSGDIAKTLRAQFGPEGGGTPTQL